MFGTSNYRKLNEDSAQLADTFLHIAFVSGVFNCHFRRLMTTLYRRMQEHLNVGQEIRLSFSVKTTASIDFADTCYAVGSCVSCVPSLLNGGTRDMDIRSKQMTR
jgi:hypothetical protein